MRIQIHKNMSTLVSFSLAVVLSILGEEIPRETDLTSKLKVEICDDYESMVSLNIATINEPLFKVKGIR